MINILVADDDKNTRLLMKAILERAGYDVFTAVDGQDALEILEREHIDLVVLDVMMPRMDGYTFTETLRQGNSNLPVLMVSAKQLPADKHKGFLVGTDDYITKPVDEEEMLLRIRALLRRAKIANDRRIVVGDVVLDYDSFTVSRPGQTQELPQKEFLLLYKLLSYPGKIFTRIQLMDEIWGMDCETGWETVTVHVGRLRKRFEGWDEFSVESVRGLGYKAVKKEGPRKNAPATIPLPCCSPCSPSPFWRCRCCWQWALCMCSPGSTCCPFPPWACPAPCRCCC